MNEATSTVLLLALLGVTTGCTAAAPTPVAAHAPAMTLVATAPAAATPGTVKDSGLLPGASSLADFAASAPAAASCQAETARGFTGFYASDPWKKGEVVLTFDDGPHPTGTPRVLDLLAQHQMPATFFVVGRAISRDTYPLVQRAVAEGHTLGSHSYSHDVHMTRVEAPEAAHDDILGQHQVTAILIDLALLARSGDDFDGMFRQVFQHEPSRWLAASTIRKERLAFVANHQQLLGARGFDDGARPYEVLYSRPPGGGPYVEHDGAAGIALHDAALSELSMMNVMWHGASGDTDPAKRGDFAFLTANMEKTAKSGGVLLVHDYIRADALAHALGRIAHSSEMRVIPMETAVQRKFGCASSALGAELRSAKEIALGG